jgi:nitronate monooxygenase
MQRQNFLFLIGLAVAALILPNHGVEAYSNGAPAFPRVIQGGMGIRISKWELAREVSKQGQLGVVSGTAMDTVLARELQKGDPEGSMRKALASFPDQGMSNRILGKYFIEGGKDPQKPYKSIPMWSIKPSQHLFEVCVLANYCEVWLAKHNDDGSPIPDALVGLNLLTKVQLPTIASLYGAMIAEVDYIVMGAGIPMHIPGILDNLADCEDCRQELNLVDHSEDVVLEFSPKNFWEAAGRPDLAVPHERPKFVPIVSSVVLAQSMLKRASGKGPTKGIDGFVVELNTAGGHNAPPRGFKYDAVTKTHSAGLNEHGEPVYGAKDNVDLVKFAKAAKGLPFWLAGSYADPTKVKDVVDIGGAGVQVGTAFALCKESGMEADVKHAILNELAAKDVGVFTDPQASPTGFPFKVLELEGTLSDSESYEHRPRACSLGYLRDMYKKPDGSIGYRCAAEPLADYVKKGGEIEATQGRKCLCNSLCSNAGFPQVQPKHNYQEEMLITIGDDVNNCKRYLKKNEEGDWEYSARDVVDFLLSEFEDDTVGVKKPSKASSLSP